MHTPYYQPAQPSLPRPPPHQSLAFADDVCVALPPCGGRDCVVVGSDVWLGLAECVTERVTVDDLVIDGVDDDERVLDFVAVDECVPVLVLVEECVGGRDGVCVLDGVCDSDHVRVTDAVRVCDGDVVLVNDALALSVEVDEQLALIDGDAVGLPLPDALAVLVAVGVCGTHTPPAPHVPLAQSAGAAHGAPSIARHVAAMSV